MTEKVKEIRALEGFKSLSDSDLLARGNAVVSNLTGNSNFPTPPVDLNALKAALDLFSNLIAEALDGSKKVVAEKNKQRRAVIKMLKLLSRFVEVMCKDDMAIFKSSGFDPVALTRTIKPPLSEKIRKLERGNSGKVKAWVK